MYINPIAVNRIRSLIYLIALLQFLLVACPKVYAQGSLAQTVSTGNIGRISLGALLTKISSQARFNFAYNNRDVPADSTVIVNSYSGRLESFLQQLLGADYEFREVSGYVVIRHVPGRLTLSAEMDLKDADALSVKGHVNDANTDQPVKQVSIYAKDLLLSTLTDDAGNFEFKLKKYDGTVILTASKDNYRDTSLFLLKDVAVISAARKKRYKYDPNANGNGGVKRNRFSRLFITSRQRIQDLNLGGFFQYSPYQVSLTPGLSTRGLYNSQVINHASLNIVGGYTAGIQGVELAGVFNIDRSDVSFLQAACVFNVVGGNMKGLQLAGVYNQVAHNATGLQAAIAANASGNFSSGLQIATVANVVDSSADIQVTVVLNKAKKVKGFQLGLVNIADSSDYSIGVINLVKNGEKGIALSTDETSSLHLDFRSGGRILYGLIGAGYKLDNSDLKFSFDLGLGAHLLKKQSFSLDGEYVNEEFYGNNQKQYQINMLRILPAYKLNRHFKIFAGPELNLISSSNIDNLNIQGWVIHKEDTNNKVTAFTSGITCGLQYEW